AGPEGADRPIRLTIPVGHYVPVSTKTGAAPPQSCTDSPAPAEAQDSLPAHPESESPAALPAQVESRGSRPTTFRIVLGLGVGIGLILLTLAGKEALSSRKGAASSAITPAGAPELANNTPAPAPHRGATEGGGSPVLPA